MAAIEILKRVRPELRWTPIPGEHTEAFRAKKALQIKQTDELERTIFEAQTILGRCVPPAESKGNDTGLVVGYVQSGKTLSFTTVMALARDNGYQLIILIAGIAINLKGQSERRLLNDLGLNEDSRVWAHFENPNPSKGDATDIANVLSAWKNAKVRPQRRKAVLITVLKNHARLRNLVAVLGGMDLAGVPTLIIDDEGDQASLNTKGARNRLTGRNEVSTTYDWITQLKDVLPHHTFLQYTATPQANILLHLADVLSPTFAELVTPGSSYVGGHDFFLTRPSLAKVIPASEIPTPTNVLTSPPGTLQSALRFFLLGAAVHYVTDQKGNRSMMVHPSQQTGPHADYKNWVEASVHRWKDLLELPESDPAYRACADLFRPEYGQLQASSPDLPEFDALIDGMAQVVGDTRILQVNSTKQGEKDVKWSANDYWILIGGQKLDRGFTVEGLTVTYMPRPIGSGNADTLQQRARFFGYKSPYKGLCRVFLVQAVVDAFKEYIEHEEFIRNALTEFRGRPLVEWKRDFILDGIFSPTRPSVISLDVDRVSLDEGWAYPGRLYKDDVAILPNRALFRNVTASWKKIFGVGDAAVHERFKDKRRDSPRNFLIQDVPLANVIKDLLLNVRIPDYDDSSQHTALMLALSTVLKSNPDELCDVFLIADLQAQTRSLTSTGRPNNLFSGKSPNVDDFDQLLYVGDRALFSAGRLSVHLRTYDLLEHQNPGSRVAEDVPWFAVHVPVHFAKDMVIEARS